MANVLDVLSDDVLFDMYGTPSCSIQSLADFYGVSNRQMWVRLNRSPDRYSEAQIIRARLLHDYAIKQLTLEPERMLDAGGNDRIDPSSVALLRFRHDGAHRMAGVLDRKLSDRARLDVEVSASPLAEYMARIAAAGSSIPISSGEPEAIEGECHTIED